MKALSSINEFKDFIQNRRDQDGYKDPIAFGICRVDYGQYNVEKVLQATYPVINWNENAGSAAVFISALEKSGTVVDFNNSEAVYSIGFNFIKNAISIFAPYLNEAVGEKHKNVQLIRELQAVAETDGMIEGEYRAVFLFDDSPLKSVEATYLKLYALSSGKAELRSINLDGAFGALPNVAWSGNVPIELEWLRANEIELKLRNEYPVVDFVDKFPRLLQHVILADNTRILESSKVRMGAQLAAGTTVMPGASYINFNAGTLGSVMVEGRISSSAIVGSGSDIGGGASILGVLSGTDGNPISIGQNTLLGANSTCGIPLGDGCIIDAGLAILEGTKISISNAELKKIDEANIDISLKGSIFKGVELGGLNGIHFRQNSTTGEVVALRSVREVRLNEELH